MGLPFRTTVQHQHVRRPPDNPSTPGRIFDSVFAEQGVANQGRQVYNELIVFDRSQVYPEYMVFYETELARGEDRDASDNRTSESLHWHVWRHEELHWHVSAR
eukprot:1274660-Rhodomonas_salina.1